MKKLESICIIDDDDIYTFLLKKTLKKIDLCNQVHSYVNGLEGIENLKKLIDNHEVLPDIILLDINMPMLDGWEFLNEFEKIKDKIDKNIAIYVVSSSISVIDINKAKNHPEVVDFLTKPIEADTLLKIAQYSNN
jgi:CheY-like chemotaxis protein